MKNETIQIKNKIELDKDVKIAPFKKEIRKTTAHKHENYFEIIYLSKGSGFHYIDTQIHSIKPPVIYFVRKEQVHYWDLTEEPEGYVLIVKKSFIEKTLDHEIKSLFTKFSKISCLSVIDNSTIEKLFELLIIENGSTNKNTFTIIEGLLKALLSKIIDVTKPMMNVLETKSDVYQSFLNVLNSEKAIKNKVAFYAELLQISSQQLNTICRKAVNQSATEILNELIVSESKRLLIYTNKTVSEISYQLDFTDPSHFVKFFKKNVNQTPNSFRLSS